MLTTTVSGEIFYVFELYLWWFKRQKVKSTIYILDDFIQKRSQCHSWRQLLFFYFWTDHNFSILSITIYNLGLSSYKRKDWVITAATLFWCCIIEFRAEHLTEDKTIKLMRTHWKCTQPFGLARHFSVNKINNQCIKKFFHMQLFMKNSCHWHVINSP